MINAQNAHSRSRAPVACAALLSLTVAACAGMGSDEGLDATAVRAVARAVEAAAPDHRLVVLHTVDGPDGDELAWGVQQSLTTAGMELGDTAVLSDPAVRLLVFVGGTRVDGDWSIRTRLLQRDAPAVGTTWRVRCHDNTCDVVDSVPTGPPAP